MCALGLDRQANHQAQKTYFDETHYGYRTFSDLLKDTQAQKLLELQLDERSGGYIIVGLGPEA